MLNRQTGRRIDRHTDEFASLQNQGERVFSFRSHSLGSERFAVTVTLDWISDGRILIMMFNELLQNSDSSENSQHC